MIFLRESLRAVRLVRRCLVRFRDRLVVVIAICVRIRSLRVYGFFGIYRILGRIEIAAVIDGHIGNVIRSGNVIDRLDCVSERKYEGLLAFCCRLRLGSGLCRCLCNRCRCLGLLREIDIELVLFLELGLLFLELEVRKRDVRYFLGRYLLGLGCVRIVAENERRSILKLFRACLAVRIERLGHRGNCSICFRLACDSTGSKYDLFSLIDYFRRLDLLRRDNCFRLSLYLFLRLYLKLFSLCLRGIQLVLLFLQSLCQDAVASLCKEEGIEVLDRLCRGIVLIGRERGLGYGLHLHGLFVSDYRLSCRRLRLYACHERRRLNLRCRLNDGLCREISCSLSRLRILGR